jgi:hypothetical protein
LLGVRDQVQKLLGLPGVCIAAFQNRGVQVLRYESQNFVLRGKVALTDLSGHLDPHAAFKDNIESVTDLPEAAYDLALLLAILQLQALKHFQGIFQAFITQ